MVSACNTVLSIAIIECGSMGRTMGGKKRKPDPKPKNRKQKEKLPKRKNNR